MLSASEPLTPYRLARQIGAGGLGAVFEAVHVETGERLAIKLLPRAAAQDPQLSARFRREAEVTRRIAHPSVVRIFDFRTLDDGSSFLVMEYLDGESIHARLSRRRRLPLLEALRLHAQIAGALTTAHACGVIHRDLKPANVMLVPDPAVAGGERAKVLDFGIAKAATSEFTQIGTHDGRSLMGTLAYMAPEQFMTPSRVTGQADVYSLGVMLHAALTGAPPFLIDPPPRSFASELAQYYELHAYAPPPPLPPDIDPDVRDLVTAMLAKAPEKRPSMARVERQLLALVDARLVLQSGGAATCFVVPPSFQQTRVAVSMPTAPLPEVKPELRHEETRRLRSLRRLIPLALALSLGWALLATLLLLLRQ